MSRATSCFIVLLAAGLCGATSVVLGGPGRLSRDLARTFIEPWVVGKAGSYQVSIETRLGISPIDVDFDEPGDVEVLPDMSALMTGLNTGATPQETSALVLARPDAGGFSYSERDAVDFPGRDLIGVAYDPASALIYLLDCVAEEILVGQYGGGDVLPTSWASFADSSIVAFLGDVKDYELSFDANVVPGQLLLSHFAEPVNQARYAVPLTAPWNGAVEAEGTNNRASFSDDIVVLGQTGIPVVGPASTLVQIVRESDSVVLGMGVTDAQGVATVVIPPAQIGEVYGVQSSHSATPTHWKTPVEYWGPPQSFPSGATLRAFRASLALDLYVDNPYFMVSLKCDDPGNGEAGNTYTAFLVVGTAELVVPFQGTHLLSSPAYVPTQVEFLGNEQSFLKVDIPIPNNPAFEGAPLAFQWWIFAGSQVVLSDIIGSTILPGGTDGVSAGSPNSGVEEGSAAGGIDESSEAGLRPYERLVLRAGGKVSPVLLNEVRTKGR